MDAITLHDAFIPAGLRGTADRAAGRLGRGRRDLGAHLQRGHHARRALRAGRRLPHGRASPGWCLGGGFGSYSKNYGTAAASLLEAEIVTADGAVRIANACTHPDLFWALKGGGGGTFGMVTRLTLRTHALPEQFGFVSTSIHAVSDEAFRRLIGRFVDFYADSLMNPHWGEIVNIRAGRRLDIAMASQGLDDPQAEAIWSPFLQWVAEAGLDIAFLTPPVLRSGPARHRWDPPFLKARLPSARAVRQPARRVDTTTSSGLPTSPRPGISSTATNRSGFPRRCCGPSNGRGLPTRCSRPAGIWPIELHFQKGLAGAAPEVIAAAADTATNPAVRDAFVLAIIGSEGPPAWPGLLGYAPDLAAARRDAVQVGKATDVLRKVAPEPAAYVAESSFFQGEWQRAYWGGNYQRLLEIKRRYDPSGLFFVHHGVGSEEWSEDGFTRVAGQ